jgi:hypothetical protein
MQRGREDRAQTRSSISNSRFIIPVQEAGLGRTLVPFEQSFPSAAFYIVQDRDSNLGGLPRRIRMLNQVCQYLEVHEEEHMRSRDWRAVLCIGALLTSYGCVTNATTELTSAPTDAISDLTHGTTAALSEFTDPLTEFTSSTTPGAGGAQNPVRAKKRLQVFTASSYDNLRSDISRGYGEYLVSLATLAGVPSAQFPEFQSLMQDSYSTMFDDVIPPAESTRQIVEIAWAAGYGHTP